MSLVLECCNLMQQFLITLLTVSAGLVAILVSLEALIRVGFTAVKHFLSANVRHNQL